MKYFSLFSGVGGFELAINNVYERLLDIPKGRGQGNESLQFQEDSVHITTQPDERQRATCVGYSEIDKYAISVYQYHYKHKNYGDITQIDWNTVPDFDLVVGGSPCQDLSVAGKQKGLSGERSGLFFEFVRCLKEKQPTNFIWENVKGALSSSSGWDFARVQIEFSEAGYDVEWQVLNAKDFGVPQNRERVFVVGHLGGKSRPKVFPITTDNSQALKELTKGQSEGYRVYNPDGIAINLASNAGGVGAKTGLYGFDLSTDGLRIRRLTPTECERLMSWPDNWTKEPNISDTQRYKMCGNGVVSKVVEAIIERLLPTKE